MKQFFGIMFLLGLASFAQATVQIHSTYEPIAHAKPGATGCAVSFQSHQGTNSKTLIMTYADSESQNCAIQGQSVAFQCDGYFCHSGDLNAYRADYLALYSSADSSHLLIRINHCRSGCRPFGTITYQPLAPQNANYQLRD